MYLARPFGHTVLAVSASGKSVEVALLNCTSGEGVAERVVVAVVVGLPTGEHGGIDCEGRLGPSLVAGSKETILCRVKASREKKLDWIRRFLML